MLAGTVRGTLYGQAEVDVPSVRYGLTEAVLAAKRGGPRRFARIETPFALLRRLRAAVVDVRLVPTPVMTSVRELVHEFCPSPSHELRPANAASEWFSALAGCRPGHPYHAVGRTKGPRSQRHQNRPQVSAKP